MCRCAVPYVLDGRAQVRAVVLELHMCRIGEFRGCFVDRAWELIGESDQPMPYIGREVTACFDGRQSLASERTSGVHTRFE